MKTFLPITSLLLFGALVASASAQESSVLAKCIGKPIAAYGVAFDQPGIEAVKTPKGAASKSSFKTGSAGIDVLQYAKDSIVTSIEADFYQVPDLTWQKALSELGLGETASKIKRDGRKFLLVVKAGPHLTLNATFDPKNPENLGNPSMHLMVKKG